jgi:hypothetical protein
MCVCVLCVRVCVCLCVRACVRVYGDGGECSQAVLAVGEKWTVLPSRGRVAHECTEGIR